MHWIKLSLSNFGNQLDLVKVLLTLSTFDLVLVIGLDLELDREPILVRERAHTPDCIHDRLTVCRSIVSCRRLANWQRLVWLAHLGA